jgi:hypothetical protein
MRNLSLIPSLSDKLPPIEDITDQLPRKQTWEEMPKKLIINGVWDGETYHTGFRDPEDIDTLIIHHTAEDAPIENHAKYHSRKWGAGIAYHLIIDKGRIYQVNDLRSFTFHVGGHNTYTVGITINADLSKREMTSQERELLYGAILTVKSVLPIKYILGHNQLNKTACPATSMNQIRADIEKLEQQIIYEQSLEHKKTTAYAIANTILYTFRLAQGMDEHGKPVNEETQHWALNRLLELGPVMREKGFIK